MATRLNNSSISILIPSARVVLSVELTATTSSNKCCCGDGQLCSYQIRIRRDYYCCCGGGAAVGATVVIFLGTLITGGRKLNHLLSGTSWSSSHSQGPHLSINLFPQHSQLCTRLCTLFMQHWCDQKKQVSEPHSVGGGYAVLVKV